MDKRKSGSGNESSAVAVRDLANQLALANGGEIMVITPEMRKKMGNLLVVVSRNGNTVVLNGGHCMGLKNGVELPTSEFNEKQTGIQCFYNPKFRSDGSMDLR